MFSKEFAKALIAAVGEYGPGLIISIIDSWDDPDPTVEELQKRLDALPKAEDAFKGK